MNSKLDKLLTRYALHRKTPSHVNPTNEKANTMSEKPLNRQTAPSLGKHYITTYTWARSKQHIKN